MESGAKRCEGYRRYGGAFTLGPVRWEQCDENAIVMIKIVQDGEKKTFPACQECWKEAATHGLCILKVTLL
jgi:hypothetical protein